MENFIKGINFITNYIIFLMLLKTTYIITVKFKKIHLLPLNNNNFGIYFIKVLLKRYDMM